MASARLIIDGRLMGQLMGLLLGSAHVRFQPPMQLAISQQLKPESSPSASLMEKYRQLKSTLGTAQSYLATWNEVIMKVSRVDF